MRENIWGKWWDSWFFFWFEMIREKEWSLTLILIQSSISLYTQGTPDEACGTWRQSRRKKGREQRGMWSKNVVGNKWVVPECLFHKVLFESDLSAKIKFFFFSVICNDKWRLLQILVQSDSQTDYSHLLSKFHSDTFYLFYFFNYLTGCQVYIGLVYGGLLSFFRNKNVFILFNFSK